MCLVFVCVGFVVVCVFGISLFLFCLCVFVVFSPGLLDLQFAAKSGTPDWRASNPSRWCVRLNSSVRIPSRKKRAWRARRWPYCTKELNVKQRVLFCLILLSLVDYTVPFDFFFPFVNITGDICSRFWLSRERALLARPALQFRVENSKKNARKLDPQVKKLLIRTSRVSSLALNVRIVIKSKIEFQFAGKTLPLFLGNGPPSHDIC